MASPIALAAPSPGPGTARLSVSSVIATLECAGLSDTIFGCTPFVASEVAQGRLCR